MMDRTGVVAKMEAKAKAEREAREESTRRGLPNPVIGRRVFGPPPDLEQSTSARDTRTEEIADLIGKALSKGTVKVTDADYGIPLEDVELWPQGGHVRRGVHLALEQRLLSMPVTTAKSIVSPLNYKATHNVLRSLKKTHPAMKFVCRAEGDAPKESPEAKIRVWRVA